MTGARDGPIDLTNSCGLSRYRARLESPSDHSSAEGSGSNPTCVAGVNPGPQTLAGQETPELPAGQANPKPPPVDPPAILVVGEAVDDSEINADHSEVNSVHGLIVPSVVNDDCSEGSQCSWDETRSYRTFMPPIGGRRGSDSSDSERDGDVDYPDEDVYDSDLETVPDIVKHDHAKKMRKWRAQASNRCERMLLECIVNTNLIRPNYQDIFIDRRTIQKLEHVTTLSLTKGRAFSHGILRGNRVTGAVLYGPPGTGKSLLAKGMAKQSGFNMIAISTAELWQKCHGEDEKAIKALFSLARKLYPSIVFVDEADALLGARKAGEKRHIRAMLNKFLMEWDGLTSGVDSPFVLLATNRPFDLDPAVLRRAPVHIHLDVPTEKERSGILGLLLKEEILAADITIKKLALLTTKYTGSDLKNLCVTAATSCVAEQEEDTAKRVLYRRHFTSALNTVKATGLGKTMANEFQNFEKNARHEETRYEDQSEYGVPSGMRPVLAKQRT